ncbi:SRPBCC domain-containing protein [Mucilaginibacter sp. CSA2-8R]|uniref:SRPBCC family protein n=1 Tax=Mucilaginibacter sp. CSA2-8R TaxID=3141542 RepID=UPI00315CB25B
MANQPYTIEQVYAAPVSRVWQALTDKDQMKQWYFDLAEFKPEVGFTFYFTGGPDGGIKYRHICCITEVIENQKLSYTWSYEGYAGESEVIFEIFDEGECTRLKLTHKGLETFPADNPDFDAKNFAAGWGYLIGTSLKNYLESN